MLRIIEQEAALCWSSHHLSKRPIDLGQNHHNATHFSLLQRSFWSSFFQSVFSVVVFGSSWT
jgi:hypothetical protein